MVGSNPSTLSKFPSVTEIYKRRWKLWEWKVMVRVRFYTAVKVSIGQYQQDDKLWLTEREGLEIASAEAMTAAIAKRENFILIRFFWKIGRRLFNLSKLWNYAGNKQRKFEWQLCFFRIVIICVHLSRLIQLAMQDIFQIQARKISAPQEEKPTAFFNWVTFLKVSKSVAYGLTTF